MPRLSVHVKGGTQAGIKTVRPRPKDWTCPTCGTFLKKHWLQCPHDGTQRPDKEK